CRDSGLTMPAPEVPESRGRDDAELRAWLAGTAGIEASMERELTRALTKNAIEAMRLGKDVSLVDDSPEPAGEDDTVERVTSFLSDRLSAKVTREHRLELVTELVALAARVPEPVWKDELRFRIGQFNRAAEKRAADQLAAEEFASILDSDGERPPNADLLRRLRSVADGDAEFDPRLRTEATDAVDAMERARQMADIERRVVADLENRGYRVESQRVTRTGGNRLELRHDDWDSEVVHAAFDPDGRLTARLRNAGDSGPSHDAERQWCQDLVDVHEDLAGTGVESRITELEQPAEKESATQTELSRRLKQPQWRHRQ
ncbi:MAG: hypothetical protein ACRD0P_29025, partial [Stackebrandtia sp.]